MLTTRRKVAAAALGVGLTLSSATQLRLSTMPIGPGECVLLVWAVARMLGAHATDREAAAKRLLSPFLVFWAVSYLVLTLDLLYFQMVGNYEGEPFHAYVAYGFTIFLLVAWTMGDRGDSRFALTVFAASSTVACLGFLVVASQSGSLGPVQLWLGGERFRAWAKNPNQLAFLISVMPFFSFWALRGRAGFARALLVFSFPTALSVGLMTQSDALILSWILATVAVAVVAYMRRRGRELSLWNQFLRYFALPLLVIGGLVAFGSQLYSGASEKAGAVYHQHRQGDLRMLHWKHGIEAIVSSPLFGLGPGPHSGEVAPFTGRESHNALIDWTASTGLIGFVALLWLGAWVFRVAWRSREPSLIGALVALYGFSFFHDTLRHPIFWFGMVFIVEQARETSRLPRSLTAGRS